MTLILKVKSMFTSAKGSITDLSDKKSLLHDLTGATAIEYALLVAMIGMVIILGLSQVGTSTQGILQLVTNIFNDASPRT